jgi:hypothetical protein
MVNGEPRMHAYRCYFLGGDGHFRDVETFTEAGDCAAVAKAHKLLSERDRFASFEVWQEARFVAGSIADQDDRRARFIAERTAELLRDLDQVEGRLDLVERAIHKSLLN